MHAVFGPIIHARHSNFPKTQPDIAPSRGAAGRACTELGAQRSWRRLIGSARGSSEHPVIVWYGGSVPRLKLARAGRRHTHLRPISALGGRHNVDCVERRRAPLAPWLGALVAGQSLCLLPLPTCCLFARRGSAEPCVLPLPLCLARRGSRAELRVPAGLESASTDLGWTKVGTSGRTKPLPPATAHLLSFCEARQHRAVTCVCYHCPCLARRGSRAELRVPAGLG
jgi:hypothetical protein